MKTLALVIGNDDYYENSKLVNAVNDAVAIAGVFERLGFTVISKNNCSSEDCTDLLQQFETSLSSFDASIFYFAGHGFEIDGENYLAGVECQVINPNKYQCNRTCIRLSEILCIYKKYNSKINIAIIDACRKSFDRGPAVTFSPIQAPKGALIAFSTSPNEGASDRGFEGHSIYTGALLQYIGREQLSVEDLFKKVRKTVHNISEGRQTTWEHTSIIGDYYFNTGQLVLSISIPYHESVVKDINYNSTDEFGKLINDMRSCNWNLQNPAISSVVKIPALELDCNQQFILGRNLLQSSTNAYNASAFMGNINYNISKYTFKGRNHVLNGLLFEIYYDSYGNFRKNKTKKHYLEDILELRKIGKYADSFNFITNLLSKEEYSTMYIPKQMDEVIDIDIVAENTTIRDSYSNEIHYEIIRKINFNLTDITEQMIIYNLNGVDINTLKKSLADFLTAPADLIHINSNVGLNNVSLARALLLEEDLPF